MPLAKIHVLAGGESISFGRGLAQRAHISEKDSRVAS
jgi:hypothetical protein